MTRRELLDALTHDVRLGAVALLGATLVSGNKRAKIVETEAYRGIDDPGSHAHRGPTPRNQIMFGPPGYAYVYFTYGMHWMLNVTAQTPGIGAAVLIRAAQPLEALEEMRANRARAKSDADLLSGPAKICAAFGVEAAQYGLDLLDPNCELRIEPEPPPLNILFGPRIGLAEGKGERHRWRFVDGDLLPWVSKPKAGLEPLKQAPNTIDPEASPRPSSSASPDRRSAKPRSPEAAPVPKASKRTDTMR